MSELKQIFDEFHRGQKTFGDDIARLINVVLLSFVYFIGVGISWAITRFSEKELLDLKLNPKSKTYWEKLDITNKPIKEYYRQF
jgi:hypothetical protein